MNADTEKILDCIVKFWIPWRPLHLSTKIVRCYVAFLHLSIHDQRWATMVVVVGGKVYNLV